MRFRKILSGPILTAEISKKKYTTQFPAASDSRLFGIRFTRQQYCTKKRILMENEHQQVLDQLTRWIDQGEMCWLCTVVKTWGSSPRPVGSLLCCNSQGHVAGSLSGGCIEEDLLDKLQAGELATERPEVLIYGGTPEESERLGLPCGGQLHVVIEPMRDKSALPCFEQIVARLKARKCIERTLDLTTGEMTVENSDRFRHLQFPDPTDEDKPTDHHGCLRQTFGPRYQLLLIGAGQISSYLASMAQALDYHVVVCDPRQEVLDQWQVDGVQLVNKMPDDAVRELANDSFTAIIALTHDPRIDDMGLMEALRTDAFFVGALGSTRTSAKRRERLQQLDLTEAEISRLHGPVGLSIGSKTPAEIAISILAQLTSLKSLAAAKEQPLAVD
jgi:xanthine dehydrogenase accessory factor